MSGHFSESGQLVLPFAEKEYVDVARAARILGVSIPKIYALAQTKDVHDRPLLALINYRHHGRKRILYSSIVAFCDHLRARHSIEDRRPKLDNPMLRHRDADLLPFPIADTIYSGEVMAALGFEDQQPMICLIEEGKFEGYQLVRAGRWRISRSSFIRFLAETRDKAS